MDYYGTKDLLLSVENVGGGISLFSNGREVGFYQETLEAAKADVILMQISQLLKMGNFDIRRIGTIVLSKTDENSTGSKIYTATIKGLAKSLKCLQLNVSAFEALLLEVSENSDGDYTAVMPVGKNRFQWQIFTKEGRIFNKKNPAIQTSLKNDFHKIIESSCSNRIIVESSWRNFAAIFGIADIDRRFIYSRRRLSELSGTLIMANASDNI